MLFVIFVISIIFPWNIEALLSEPHSRAGKGRVSLSDIGIGPCNIPIVTESITQDEFLQQYAYTSPVIFKKSFFSPTRNRQFEIECDLVNLVKNYGQKYVTISTANTYSYKKHSIQFAEYLNKYVLISSNEYEKFKYGNETWYFFGENNVTEWGQLFDLYERPQYTLPLHTHAYSFGVAAGATGN